MPSEATYFPTPAAFRRWLEKHHDRANELLVGFYKKGSGRPSITWPEAVDEALCFGWIDGVRRSIDDERYTIRFTPRKPTSTWSAVNRKRIEALNAEGRVHEAGLAAYRSRRPDRTGIYAYENRKAAKLDPESERTFRAEREAWRYFSEQPPSYTLTVIWWVISAKRPETRRRRLEKLIAHSKAREWLPQLRRPTGESRRKTRE